VGEGGRFWWRWLTAVSILVLVFGAALFLAPGLLLHVFNLLFFGATEGKSAFAPATDYLRFAFATLGAVMLGWAACMLVVLTRRRGSRDAWLAVSVSLVAWFVPDTVYSMVAGFWQNAILNTLIAVLFAVPLVAIHREWRDT